MSKRSEAVTQIPEPALSKFLFADTRLGLLWLFLRVYIGWQWLVAGWGKVTNPAWVGPEAGKGVEGFAMGALQKTTGAHPDVTGWYADWLTNVVIPNSGVFAHIVAFGEVLVGVGLLLGLFTGIAAFFGAFMNMNFLFAGAISSNPVMLLVQLFLILAWRVAGWWGLDRYILPLLGTPWEPGEAFKGKKK